ncbi:PREDICTED: homeobox protein knotted-1-like 1, partial [Lupinus angustifolius]|uniref:homeobox protein knotted-1-like 1 n=1 Tax=Lupinus angustifolius TaxID=3871 RepID=UPI00092E5780
YLQQQNDEDEDEEEEEQEEGDQEEENNEILERRISSHPLCGLLVETHLECLKVGDISNLDSELKINHQMQAMKKQNLEMFSQSQLDLFMEAYCLALSQLKEAMEELQKKSMAFINNMHSQLRELTMAAMLTPSKLDNATSSTSTNMESKRNRSQLGFSTSIPISFEPFLDIFEPNRNAGSGRDFAAILALIFRKVLES